MTKDLYIFSIPLTYFAISLLSLLFRSAVSKKMLILFSVLVNILGLASVLYFSNATFSTTKIPWIIVGNTQVDIDIYLDNASWLMLGLVQFISLGVQLFSIKYMEKDGRITTYYAFLNLFIGSMLGLVISGNLLLVFLFWELVGFCSYLLIGFWYQKKSATEAACKAFMINKVGDSFLLIGIGLIFASTGTFEIEVIKKAILSNPELSLLPIASFMLFLGSLAKSAQLPLQVWLPDAMEGPTPVSALIHAATMVAAGIFLLARMDFILTELTLICIASIGAITAFLAGYSAIFQWDIKKILAYSTISQLGMMMVAIGIGHADAALFHLFTHAFFKAALFLIAGALIHYVHHEQDIRELSDIAKNKTFLKVAFLICGASLAGLPLFSGYLSKETILLSTLAWDSGVVHLDYLIPLFFILSSLFTVIYLSKIAYYVFFRKKVKSSMHWSFMEIVILVLSVMSLAIPHSFSIIEPTKSHFSNYFEIPETEYHTIGWIIVLLSIAIAIISFLYFKKEKPESNSIWAKMGFNHFYIDHFYSIVLTRLLIGSSHLVQLIDQLEHELEHELIETRPRVQLIKNGINGFIHKFDNLIVDGFVGFMSRTVFKMASLSSWLDSKTLDGIVNGISHRIDRTGDRLRRLQGGKLQEYLIATILILIFTAIVANLL